MTLPLVAVVFTPVTLTTSSRFTSVALASRLTATAFEAVVAAASFFATGAWFTPVMVTVSVAVAAPPCPSEIVEAKLSVAVAPALR